MNNKNLEIQYIQYQQESNFAQRCILEDSLAQMQIQKALLDNYVTDRIVLLEVLTVLIEHAHLLRFASLYHDYATHRLNDAQSPKQEVFVDRVHFRIDAKRLKADSLQTASLEPSSLDGLSLNAQGQVLLSYAYKPYAVTESRMENMDALIEQKCRDIVHDFLDGQNQIHRNIHLYNDLEKEDFQVVLLQILEKEETDELFLCFEQLRKLINDSKDKTNYEVLQACLEVLDRELSMQHSPSVQYSYVQVIKACKIEPITLHPIYEDACLHIQSQLEVFFVESNQGHVSEYQFRCPGPKSIGLWFISQSLEEISIEHLSEGLEYQKTLSLAYVFKSFVDYMSFDVINIQILLHLKDSIEAKTRQLIEKLAQDNDIEEERQSIIYIGLAEEREISKQAHDLRKHLVFIYNDLVDEANRLNKTCATNKFYSQELKYEDKRKPRISFSGVYTAKFSLLKKYLSHLDEMKLILDELKVLGISANPVDYDEICARIYAIKYALETCLDEPGNQSYRFFNRSSNTSRDNLKAILDKLNELLPESKKNQAALVL